LGGNPPGLGRRKQGGLALSPPPARGGPGPTPFLGEKGAGRGGATRPHSMQVDRTAVGGGGDCC